MSTEQQRKMLECAAKACGITGVWQKGFGICVIGDYLKDPGEQVKFWNPLANSADCAAMCAKLALDTAWGVDDVIVMVPEEEAHEAQYKDHNNSRLKAWMYAATMCAAKIGGYTE